MIASIYFSVAIAALMSAYLGLRSFSADINNLEKFPDLAFIFSIYTSGQMPPLDPFTAGESINYYYLGHYMSALIAHFTGRYPNDVFHYHVGLCFALSAIGLYVVAYRILKGIGTNLSRPIVHIGGGIAVLFGVFIGNFQAFYEYFIMRSGKFWYPDATRYIQNTIHEYPSYSYIVGDLHGHVMNMPFSILAVMVIYVWCKRLSLQDEFRFERIFKNEKTLIVLISFIAGSAYLINAWDIMTIFLLAGVTTWCAIGQKQKYFSKETITFLIKLSTAWVLLAILFYLPYWIKFSPPASGINLVPPSKSSPIMQLLIIWLIHLFFPLLFLIKRKSFKGELFFLKALVILGIFLIAFTELAYFRDIYPEHFRANTMFKIGAQVWLWLSIASAVIIAYVLAGFIELSLFERKIYVAIAGFLIGAGLFWTLRAIPQGFNLNSNAFLSSNLDGLDFLRKTEVAEIELIHWLRENVSGQPVLLQAVGDSFSEYGRVTVFTGLPTILQWPIHVWLWRGSYDRSFKPKSSIEKSFGVTDSVSMRLASVTQIYESEDLYLTRQLLDRYSVEYVLISSLERKKYPKLKEDKLVQLGQVVFEKGAVKLIKVYKN
jgi:uncharacterized membrane protein